MPGVYLLIGSNRGDRIDYLRKAVDKINQNIGNVIRNSSVYETEPYGFKDDCPFLNQCLLVETGLQPLDILRKSKQIESSLGRKKKSVKYESRTIDIDILFYDDLVIHEISLIIPHKEFHKRNFAMIPMSEINPGFVHPAFGKTVCDLLKKSNDLHKVVKFSDPLF
jgi:2-amino-4-hydroxy-6-hydroxymethyldihydropteridine diphosphokinase